MKTLKEIYEVEIGKQPVERVALTDVLFISAFPQTNIQRKIKEISRASEDTMDAFYESWKVRLKGQIEERIATGMDPQMIAATVPIITKEELLKLVEGIDEYMGAQGDTQEIFALKIVELQSHYRGLLQGASEVMKECMVDNERKRSSSKIITMKNPLITGIQ